MIMKMVRKRFLEPRKSAMAPSTGWAGSEDALAGVLRQFAAIGTSEVHLIPTSSDLGQLRAAADVVADLAREHDA